MVKSQTACTILLTVTTITSTIANLAMVIHIWKNRKNSKKTDMLFAVLGFSNFSSLAFATFTSLTLSLVNLSDTRTSLLDAVFFGLYTIVSNLNLSLNVAIAYSRFCAVAQPMRYSKENERSRLQRRLITITIISSLVLGLSNGVVLGFVQIRLVRNWIEAASRFIAYVLLCIIYVKIFRKVKAQHQSVANGIGTGSQLENSSTNESHKNHEKYLMKLFLGITISFLIFNLPFMVIRPLTGVVAGCESTEGKLITFAGTFFIIGTAFDPMWYFFLWRRIKQRQPAQRSPHEMQMVSA